MSKRNNFKLQVALYYKPLWKLPVDKDFPKQDLRQQAQLSSTSMARLNNGENIQTDTLLRICQVLDCQIGHIVEVIPATYTKEEDA